MMSEKAALLTAACGSHRSQAMNGAAEFVATPNRSN
jgi:hypothetical protein